MGLGTSTMKHILLLFNFIFAILSIILIGFGIFVLVNLPVHKFGEEIRVDIGENLAGGLIVALGVAILIISIFGCLAAIHESKRRLLIYVAVLSVLILIQLLMASMVSHGTRDGIAGSIQEGFEDLWNLEKRATPNDIEMETRGFPRALAFYEKWLNCCGVNSTSDYGAINHSIPKTCCKEQICSNKQSYFIEGCEAKFNDYVAYKMLTFNIVNGLLIVGEIVAAVFGWFLFNNLKNESRRSNLRWI